MSFFRFALWALAAALLPATSVAQDPDIIVRGDVARIEIERILDADNVDTSQLSPREVAEAIAAIGRGRAPEDFWKAYRAHVEAWNRFADAIDAARRGKSDSPLEGGAELADADRAIDVTFDEVERIARRYGARLPIPPWQVAPTI